MADPIFKAGNLLLSLLPWSVWTAADASEDWLPDGSIILILDDVVQDPVEDYSASCEISCLWNGKVWKTSGAMIFWKNSWKLL